MKAFFSSDQNQHAPQLNYGYGGMEESTELPERTSQILEGLAGLDVTVEAPTEHGLSVIKKVHDPAYIAFLNAAKRRWDLAEISSGDVMTTLHVPAPPEAYGILAEASRYQKDGSCPIGSQTFRSAYLSAQSALTAADDIVAGAELAYSLSRPPGHHAGRAGAGGSCYLNNAAIAAEALRVSGKFSRVAILDLDMHHGQGIEEIFYHRDDVLYVSVHATTTNFYPVASGFVSSRGTGAGKGFNINLPVLHGSSEESFFDYVNHAIMAVRAFEPDVLVVPMGFDIYHQDPQSKVEVTTEGIYQLGQQLAEINLPTLVVQEGGSHLPSLATNTEKFFQGLGVATR